MSGDAPQLAVHKKDLQRWAGAAWKPNSSLVGIVISRIPCLPLAQLSIGLLNKFEVLKHFHQKNTAVHQIYCKHNDFLNINWSRLDWEHVGMGLKPVFRCATTPQTLFFPAKTTFS